MLQLVIIMNIMPLLFYSPLALPVTLKASLKAKDKMSRYVSRP